MKILYKELSCCAGCPACYWDDYREDYYCNMNSKSIFFPMVKSEIIENCPLPDKLEQMPIRTSPEN